MPMYMDRHELQGASAEDIAMAHVRDLEVQSRHGVRYLTYWFDYNRGRAFCLVDAPSPDAAEAVHREAHGQIAGSIIPVDEETVEQFLGRIEDRQAAQEPAKPVAETAFRTILFTDMEGSTEYTQRFGDAKAMELLETHNRLIRRPLVALGGREIKHTGDGIMSCFSSVSRAVECAIAVQREFDAHGQTHPEEQIRIRIGMSAGEPVESHDDLFGATVQLAARICDRADAGRILVSNAVKELAMGKGFLFEDRGEAELKGFPEPVRLHEVVWRME